MSLPVIAAMLESRKKPSFTYRRRKLSGEIAWLKANFIYASEEKRSVIIAYYDDTEEVVARLNERKKIELQDEGIRFMAQNLCEDFLIADLESGACSMVTPDTGNMVAKGTFKEQVDWFAENIVAPEEREAYLHYFNLANLVPHIRKNNGFCTMNCTVIYKDGRYPARRGRSGQHAALYVIDCKPEVENRRRGRHALTADVFLLPCSQTAAGSPGEVRWSISCGR